MIVGRLILMIAGFVGSGVESGIGALGVGEVAVSQTVRGNLILRSRERYTDEISQPSSFRYVS
jgi:hypothetical protein